MLRNILKPIISYWAGWFQPFFAFCRRSLTIAAISPSLNRASAKNASHATTTTAAAAAAAAAITLFVATSQTIAADALDPVVVTGSRIEVRSSDSPVSTQVVGGEALDREHTDDLTEVLEKVPGAFIEENPRRSGQSAVVQGLGGKHVLVMVDGVPLTQNANAGFDLKQLDARDIRQVEVVKGGASALYGSQAMGGVINVITKAPTERFQYFVDANSGAYSGAAKQDSSGLPSNIRAGFSGKEERSKIGYKVQLSRRQEPAIDLDPSTITKDSSASERYNGSAVVERRFGKWHRVRAKYLRIEEDTLTTRAQIAPLSGFQEVNDTTDTLTQQVVLDYTADVDVDRKFQNKVSYEWTSDTLRLNDNPSTPFAENQEVAKHSNARWEVQYDQPILDRHILTTGILVHQQTLDQDSVNSFGQGISVTSNDVDQKKLTSFEFFAQDSIIFENLTIVPGARSQYDSDFGFQFSPKVSSHYITSLAEKTKWHLRLNVGTGYRVPNLKERYYLLDHRSIAGYIVKGNNGLKPEESVSVQGSSEFFFNQRHSVKMGAFVNYVDGLIEVSEPEEALGFAQYEYKNIEKVRTHGLDLSASSFVLSNLQLSAHYSYLEPKNQTSGLFLPFRPFYSGRLQAKLFLFNKKFDFTSSLRYLGKQYANDENTEVIPRYTVTDLKTNWQLYPNARLYLGVNNVFDVKRDPAQDQSPEEVVIDSRPAKGRFFYLGFSIQG